MGGSSSSMLRGRREGEERKSGAHEPFEYDKYMYMSTCNMYMYVNSTCTCMCTVYVRDHILLELS